MTVQDTHTIRVNKANETFTVDVSKFPEASYNHVLAYGLRQILNDAAAGTEAGADSAKAVQARLNRLMEGTLRASTGRTSDPVAKRAKEIATAAVDAAIRAKGRKPADVKNRTDLINAQAAKPSVQAQAKADVAAMADLDLDIEI